MNPSELLGGILNHFHEPEYVTDLREEYHKDYLKRFYQTNSILEDTSADLLLQARQLDDADARLKKVLDERNVRLTEEQKRIFLDVDAHTEGLAMMRKAFTQDFHDQLADFMNQHFETLCVIIDQNHLEFDNELDHLLNKIDVYNKAISYINNFAVTEQDEKNEDLKRFLAHREYGSKLANELAADMRFLKKKRFVSDREFAGIVNRYSELHHPIENLIGTLHKRVRLMGQGMLM